VQPAPEETPAPQPVAAIQVHSTIETFEPVKVSEHVEGDFKEYLLRRTKDGNRALSLLADEELIHIIEANRDKAGTISTQEKFMVKKEAILGISHNKFDWLDRFKLGWWSMFAGGLTLSILGISSGSTLLLAGLFFSCWQFADPEMITLETTTGRRRLMLNRMGSDRELMGCSMNHFSSTMKELLTSGELNTSNFEASIETLMLERAAQLQAAAEQAADLPLPTPATSAQPVMAASAELPAPAPLGEQPSPTQMDASPLTTPSPNPVAEVESTEVPQQESQEQESSDWGDATEWADSTPEELPEPAPPPELGEPAPPAELPEPAPPPELGEPAPPAELPEPAPPVELGEPAPPAELPEPAPPPELSPPPAPAPPPGLAPLPAPTPPLPIPPPGLALPPIPPLPSIDPLLMNPDAPMPPPPETVVAGSPREDRMSMDEKDDLLSMLDD